MVHLICLLFMNFYIFGEEVTDFSKIYYGEVDRILYPTTVKEIQVIVKAAVKNKKHISIAGVRHSQGGQSHGSGSINIDMTAFNKIISLNVADKIIRVEAGATWKDIQDVLHMFNLSVQVMQSSNIFTVGGSVSVNVHGRDPHVGPLIENVQAVTIVNAAGNLQNISRADDPELFSLVVGGYGLFGIIVYVDLHVVDNCVCEKEQFFCDYADYTSYLQRSVLTNKKIQLHYARLVNIPGKDYLKKVVCVNYLCKGPVFKVVPLPEENQSVVRNFMYKAYRSLWGKVVNRIRWFLEEHITAPWEKVDQLTRNHIMRPYVNILQDGSKKTTDLLQEYFIPLDQFELFVEHFEQLSKKYKIKLLNVTLRYVPKNTESLLSYSHENMIAFVLYFAVPLKIKSIDTVRMYTQQLTDLCLDCGGNFYLPYQQFATPAQLQRAYPPWKKCIALKQKYDPSNLFVSNWYLQYILPSFV